ncbi:MAG: glycoside hydrolase family 15 protein [Protaetiibacter sp.]
MSEDRARLVDIARLSHDLIVGNQHENGAYPASPTFSAYRGYSWLRDGAFIAEGVSRYGDVESANRFHDWVAARLTERRGQVDDLIARRGRGEMLQAADMLPTRFPIEDPTEPDTWWNFQTDGYGTWLWSVVVHAERHGQQLDRWKSGIERAVDYAATFWDVPCYDWWEENVDRRHGSTLGALFGGLSAIARVAVLDPGRRDAALEAADGIRRLVLAEGLSADGTHLAKWLGNDAVDASLASCVIPFGLVAADAPIARATIAAVSEDLDIDGGVHRYLADVFYGGGQWLLLSCLLGWNEVAAGRPDAALAHLRWVADHLTPDGEFPEQVPDHLLHPEHREHWIGEWGPVATPLLWSHGMYLILADELGLTSR